jgi:hypothetical protein
MKKIAFVNFHNSWPVHQETELEIMSGYENSECELFKFHCNGILKQCDLNVNADFTTCVGCRKKDLSGLVLINKPVKVININTDKFEESIPLFKNIDELKAFKYDEFDVGYAVLSSIISETRDPYLDVLGYSRKIEQKIIKSIELYRFFIQIFEEQKFSEIYIFNGRFAYERAALRAAEKLGLFYFTHERGSNKDKYMLFENSFPHDLIQFSKRIEASWDDKFLGEEEKKLLGDQFYTERKNAIDQGWTSFTKNQNQNELPDYWDSTKKNVVIFLSSEDEFMSIGDQWNNTLFKNQIEGLEFLLKEKINEFSDEFVFTIRIHPNSDVLEQFITEVKQLANHRVFVIEPLSTISTYLLMEQSWKVITFGSTMGIEASYWGKVSINLGNSFYRQLNVTHNPSNREDIINLILTEEYNFSDNINLVKYGYYMMSFGFEFQNYTSIDFFQGQFREYDLNNSSVDILNNKLINRINYYATTLFKYEFKKKLKDTYNWMDYFRLKKSLKNKSENICNYPNIQ